MKTKVNDLTNEQLDEFAACWARAQARKDAARRKDMTDFKNGVPGDVIASRNCCVQIEQLRKARVIFA